MSRPKNNEKAIKFLEDSVNAIIDRITKAVNAEDFASAMILVDWKVCLISAIDKIKEGVARNSKMVNQRPPECDGLKWNS